MTRFQAIQHDGRWLTVIGVVWIGLAAVVLWPASWWLKVDSFTVLDANLGTPPTVIVDRTIRREFRGQWVVTIMRQGSHGFYTYCTARGENDYRPGTALPDVVDLDWWTAPKRCKLHVGTYYVRTLWTIYPPSLPAKTVRVQSNEFRVSE